VVLDELKSVIDRLCETEPATLADPEAVEFLHREFARLDAVTTRATAAFDARHEYEGDGARNTAAWISRKCNVALGKAKRRVHLGRELRHMAHVEASWLTGDITADHVSALVSVRTPATAVAFANDEELLVGEARRLRFSSFVRQLKWWRYRVDADGAEGDATEAHDARELYISQSCWDLWFGKFTLDPLSGTIVDNELKRIEKEFFDADWAEARSRLGDAATANDLRRTPAQRRADAFVEMATRSAAMPAGARRPEPLFSVLVGFETFAGPLCKLANGITVTPGSLVRWLDQTWIERIVFSGPSRVIDVGTTRRIFDGATRRAILARDQECFHDFCEVAAVDCQVDHIQPYAVGGRTTQANGRVACAFHNRARHHRRR
jgi:hypothetical protein